MGDKKTEVAVAKPLFDINTVKFDYAKSQIEKMVKEVKKTDLTDLDAVKESHKILVKIRTTLNTQGLDFRRQINEIPKAIKAKEDELLEIAAGTEAELKQILDDDKQAKLIEARKELLPMKRDQLDLLEHIREFSDDEILAMDDKQWVAFYQDMMSTNAAEVSRLQAEADRKKEIEDAKEAGKAEAKEEAKEEVQEEIKQEAQQSQAAVAEKVEENPKFAKLKEKHGFNPKTDVFKEKDGYIYMMRILAKVKA